MLLLLNRYNEGNTLVHVVGHWLFLAHTFEGGCTSTGWGAGVEDTPAIAGPDYGCPSHAVDSCPDLPGNDMVTNYMDYTDDTCMNRFTEGQFIRMKQAWRYYRMPHQKTESPTVSSSCEDNKYVPFLFSNVDKVSSLKRCAWLSKRTEKTIKSFCKFRRKGPPLGEN